MGGTLPAAARAVVTRDDVSRRSLGILYGVNTLGAVTGAVIGTFYLFENFGNHLTLWWATAVNGVVALAAFHLSKSFPDLTPDSETPETSGRKIPARSRIQSSCFAQRVWSVSLFFSWRSCGTECSARSSADRHFHSD